MNRKMANKYQMNRKNRSTMHGNSRTQKAILGHRVNKVRDNRVRKEKGLTRYEAT